MVLVGQIWMRNPKMKNYWGDDAGKLVVVTTLTNSTVYYRYVDYESYDEFVHFQGARELDAFIKRFVLYKDV